MPHKHAVHRVPVANDPHAPQKTSPATPPRWPAGDHHIQPGQLVADASSRWVSTILGSCVAVCLWDPAAKIGGANHFLLPLATAGKLATPRFGEHATQTLVSDVVELGADPRKLQAKVFGGASTLGHASTRSIGARNVEVAFSVLRALTIPIFASDVGGTRGRKLRFHTGTGEAWVRLL